MTNTKKITVSLITLVLAFAMVFSMAVPAFAAGAYKDAEITILSGSTDGWNAEGTKINYQIKLFGDGVKTYGKITVKYLVNSKAVSTQTISFDSFKKNSDGTYTYKGSYTATKSGTLQFDVKDLTAATQNYSKSFDFKVDNAIPTVTVSTRESTVGSVKSTFLSISAMDDVGVKSVSIDGVVIADEKVTRNRNAFATTYRIYKDGTYIVSVEDVAGNQSITTVTVKNGDATSETVKDYPTVGSATNTGIPSALMELYKNNPLLYYYLMTGEASDAPFINSSLWYYILNGGTEGINNTILYYLLQNGGLSGDIDSTLLYYYLINGGGNNLTNDQILNQLYYYLLVNGENAEDEGIALFYYYLFNNNDGKFDNSWLLYYLLMNGEITPEIYAALLGNTAGSFPNYFYTLALEFLGGSNITWKTETTSEDGKSGVITLTAPRVLNEKYVTYKWQKLGTDNKWYTIKGATGSTYKIVFDEKNAADLLKERYRVVISSNWSTATKNSSAITITVNMFAPTPVETPDEDEDDDTVFTADDIVINGIKGNTVRVKKGSSLLLTPNYKKGFWAFDSAYLSGNASPVTILTALKSGYTYISYTAYDDAGHSATKFILVEIYE